MNLRTNWMGLAVLIAGASVPAIGWGQTTVSVTDFGAKTDGSDALHTTAAFQRAFAVNPTGQINVPAGDYLLDNSIGPVMVNNFSGVLSFQGSARILFVNNTHGGLWFEGGTGARIQGLHATYPVAPLQRYVPQEAIKFSDTTDTSVSDIQVSNSPSAGVLFYNCIRPKVMTALIQNTQADGLHFANCQDAQATNITTQNTGDDGLSFVNYAMYPNNTGATAYNVTIQHSGSRGIAVVGQSNVVVSNFRVDGTASSGILCAYDSSYNTRVPANVQFSSGTINAAGSAVNTRGNNYGIEYNGQSSCSFANIAVTASAGRGVGGMAPNGSVSLSNVQVSGNKSNEAFSFFQTQSVTVSASGSDTSPSYGFFFAQCANVIAKGLMVKNASQSSYLHRAFWFEQNQGVAASDLTVVDTQLTPTGYVVGTYDGSTGVQAGSVNGVTSRITGGTLNVQNTSRNMHFANVL